MAPSEIDSQLVCPESEEKHPENHDEDDDHDEEDEEDEDEDVEDGSDEKPTVTNKKCHRQEGGVEHPIGRRSRLVSFLPVFSYIFPLWYFHLIIVDAINGVLMVVWSRLHI